jgi:two-component system CheB/CheR fusion protein
MSPVSLKELLQQLAEKRNLDLRGYKLTTLERRFRHRMFQLRVGSFEDYADYIRHNPAEVTNLLNTVLINVTQFFRDPQAWDLLAQEILPGLTADLQPGDTFRVWCAGCASGEEAYSLAILLVEHFGDGIKDFDIKVYGTDVDDEALNLARRGKYQEDKLRYVRPEWREKYFVGEKTRRIAREIRRMLIFGRSNLASDAPISHVNLLLCRNVLIYFDSQLQKHILGRLHYALERDGILMLGKSESQLSQSPLFRVVNIKWRIFQRIEPEPREAMHLSPPARSRKEDYMVKARKDYSLLKLYHEALLQTLEPGVLLLDSHGVITNENPPLLKLFGLKEEKLTGKALRETAIPSRSPELLARLDTLVASSNEFSRFEQVLNLEDDGERHLAITLRAVISPDRSRVGTLIYVEDIASQTKLHQTIEELETTSEELQSTNEELETTNEELQSTNEELETTNEELQSTNEELETTNEELQALNEELGTTNEELEVRGKELDEVNIRYSETLENLPWPLMVVSDGHVQFWNTAIQGQFGLPSKSVVGLELRQVPLPESLRGVLHRSYRDVVSRGRSKLVRHCRIDMQGYKGYVDIRFTPLSAIEDSHGVLVAFTPCEAEPKPRSNRKTANTSKKGHKQSTKRPRR